MFNLQDTINQYKTKLAEHKVQTLKYRELTRKHEQLAKKYERLESGLKYPHWMEHYLRPLAEELSKHYPDSNFEISGPFGLDCETSISIHDSKNKLLAFIEFVPRDLENGELALRDYTKDTNKFSKGTIAEVNGMNHPDIPIPPDATIEWFLDKIQYLNKTAMQWESARS